MSVSAAINAVIKTATNEVGYLEKATNANLDSKTTNAGYANYTKYARDLDNIDGFYNGKKQGYAWCDMFVDWCFVKTFGIQTAIRMLYQGIYGAGTQESANYYKKVNRFYTSPHIGDQIFFGYNGSIEHTGLVVWINNGYVYTIEGNTSSEAGVVANGGAVRKKQYSLGYSGIIGYGRPNYDLVSDDFMTQDEFNNMANKWLSSLNTIGTSDYARGASAKGIASGLFADGDGDGLVDFPQAPMKRQEFCVVLDRAGILDEALQKKK